jgi:hypothetical protein
MESKSRFKDHIRTRSLPKAVNYNISLELIKGVRTHKLTVGITSTDIQKSIEYLKNVRFREYDVVRVIAVDGIYYNENEVLNT